jgi:hypothetical protein
VDRITTLSGLYGKIIWMGGFSVEGQSVDENQKSSQAWPYENSAHPLDLRRRVALSGARWARTPGKILLGLSRAIH